MIKLKACPFCGSDVVFQDLGDFRITVYCKKCEVTLGRVWGVNGTKDELAIVWNTRPIEDALRSENERLRAKIDREVTQFNDGYETAKAGKPESDRIYFDYEVDEDQWLIGYAWQRFDSMKLEISTIRSLLKEAKEDGERLFKATRPIYSKGGTPGFNGRRPHFCDFCGRSPAYEHKTDCPIAMHRALMEKLKQENL